MNRHKNQEPCACASAALHEVKVFVIGTIISMAAFALALHILF